MRAVKLGSAGLQVPALGLGCMVMPGFYAPGPEEDSIAAIHHARDIGVNFLDTADRYGEGKNEELVARAIKGHRNDYLIATKFGNVRTAEGKPSVNGRPDYALEACDASLKRLGTDAIDLYYLHRMDPSVPIEETVGAMSDLVTAGKVRYLGLSEAAPETLKRAHAVHPITALQTEYSLWTRDVEDDLLGLCAELGIGFVAYSPLGRGILAGAVTGADSLTEGDRRLDHPRYQGENLEANLKLVQPVLDLAAKKGVSAAQIALAWLLAQGDHIVPIPGTRKVAHLDSNVAALDIVLSADDLAALNAALPPGGTQGTRYPAGGMKWLKL